MVRLRRTGLIIFATISIVVIGAAFLIEGLGVALIAAIALLVLAALTIPLLAVFEEEHDLPEARAGRAARYPRTR